LEFAEAFRPWLDLRGILRASSGNPTAEIQGQPITVDLAEQHRRVVIEVRALTFHQEGQLTLPLSVEAVLRAAAAIDQSLPLPTMNSLRLDALYIEPFPMPFHDLVARFKEVFARPNAISDTAVDVGMSFDYQDGDVRRHIQVGPMLPAQLRTEFLIWPREPIPLQFFFISLGYEIKREMPFDRDALSEILETAAQWQRTKSEQLGRELIRPGGA
jgi:hypothetical protein